MKVFKVALPFVLGLLLVTCVACGDAMSDEELNDILNGGATQERPADDTTPE